MHHPVLLFFTLTTLEHVNKKPSQFFSDYRIKKKETNCTYSRRKTTYQETPTGVFSRQVLFSPLIFILSWLSMIVLLLVDLG